MTDYQIADDYLDRFIAAMRQTRPKRCEGSGKIPSEIHQSGINRCPVCDNLLPVFENRFTYVTDHDLTHDGRIA